MVTIGLTGGLASGKTTVMSLFEKLGAKTLSSDAIVHCHLRENKNLKKKLGEIFGPGVFKNGRVDRGRLAERVFSGRGDIETLNGLIHPLVKKGIREFIVKNRHNPKSRVVVVEVPLLFEAGFDAIFDVTIGVAIDRAAQKKRMRGHPTLKQRDLARRMRYQFSQEKKVRHCDFVIDNNGTPDDTLRQAEVLMYFFNKM